MGWRRAWRTLQRDGLACGGCARDGLASGGAHHLAEALGGSCNCVHMTSARGDLHHCSQSGCGMCSDRQLGVECVTHTRTGSRMKRCNAHKDSQPAGDSPHDS
eukprot:141771-Chlamydomonas_euryale.AAC.4